MPVEVVHRPEKATQGRRTPPPRRTRTAVGTGGGPIYWVCFSRRKFFLNEDSNCNVAVGRHRDCGWYEFTKH